MNINKQIITTISEIIFLILFTIFTNKIWNNLSINKSISTTYLNKKNLIPLNFNIENNLKNLTNEYNEKEYVKLNIQNLSDIDKDYTIYFIIDNDINIDNIKFKINDTENYITSLNYITFEEKKYYIIDENLIQKNNSIQENLYIWNNSNDYKNIIFNIELDEL